MHVQNILCQWTVSEVLVAVQHTTPGREKKNAEKKEQVTSRTIWLTKYSTPRKRNLLSRVSNMYTDKITLRGNNMNFRYFALFTFFTLHGQFLEEQCFPPRHCNLFLVVRKKRKQIRSGPPSVWLDPISHNARELVHDAKRTQERF